MDCPKPLLSHGSKVLLGSFLLASYLTYKPLPKECKQPEPIDTRGLMEHSWLPAPYKYNISSDPPTSSSELMMMKSKEAFEKVNPPEELTPDQSAIKLHYDYSIIDKNK
ncbi:hypothetical protein TKK_0008815 [Trichogramma kaykai]|uniref:Uncharacterized protein n=1 Tax=Trichogramma kaykai TaxID=54128 RepID=A0ABD2X2C3_9HYME